MKKMELEGRVLPAEPLAVRVSQAAQMLGIGKSKLYEFIAEGEIEAVKMGRSTVIPTESLREFLSRRRKRPE